MENKYYERTSETWGLKSRVVAEKSRNDSLERSHENKPFCCKYCDKSFLQVHEVIEHIKIHSSILKVEDLKQQVKSMKTQVKELQVKLKNEFKQKVEGVP